MRSSKRALANQVERRVKKDPAAGFLLLLPPEPQKKSRPIASIGIIVRDHDGLTFSFHALPLKAPLL
jgi:hypothetical protein